MRATTKRQATTRPLRPGRTKASAARTFGYARGISTALTGAESLYSKYGQPSGAMAVRRMKGTPVVAPDPRSGFPTGDETQVA
jgi:hypothetical protein